MNLRVLLAVLVLAFGLQAGADDKKVEKIDPDKLVGKWERTEKKDGSVVLEIMKDGKAKFTLTTGDGKALTADGTYKVSGNKIEMTMKLGDQEEKSNRSVTKLTDTELVTIDDKGTERSFVRVTAK
ncbi:TIGR03066 family protein [Frigoriglobus tundricola]|uniref:Lipocalin-like domain-containing protein n=1 Tax=Frigoriglobus tundricola TaxID=2774151 RepID=A0A6M5YRY7_9BACT|nr:TIGR03066 family protein [Frigoriglobus tundricola]QJW96815.1 hypothetical protein FTUN_4374 [Frigoriglobus tundricola]